MVDKKALKKQYKQTLPVMGVYIIKNNINGKIFLGSSLNLKGKENSFRFQLKSGTHMNSQLQNDYNIYGDSSFIFEIIDTLEPKDDPFYNYKDDLKVFEEMWIEKLSPFDEKGYNKRK
ncbi:MAG: GIY-YIG nuclease family protein [Bacteroidetes bacterium]|nr:GIY-YIG nuclease family protein [Bacteroidota bacterium]